MIVNQTLQDNFIRTDEAELAKAKVKFKGKHRIIDKAEARLAENHFWATLTNFSDRWVHIQEDVVKRYERLLQGGVWCQVDLVYNELEDQKPLRPFYVKALKPIQVATFDLDDYVAGRARFSRDEWLDLLVRSVGLEPSHYDLRAKLLTLTLIPMVERNYNLIELGPWGRASRSSTASSHPTPSSYPVARSPFPSCSRTTRPGGSACSATGTSSRSTRSLRSSCPTRPSSRCSRTTWSPARSRVDAMLSSPRPRRCSSATPVGRTPSSYATPTCSLTCRRQ